MANYEDEEQINRSACAACKYQRKKCRPDCILRTHFPSTRSENFKAVQKIFGISNMTKMIKGVNSQEAQDEVTKSLNWEAEMWAQDPVHGPYGYFKRQQEELEALKEYINNNNNFGGNLNLMMNYNNNYYGTNWTLMEGNSVNSYTGLVQSIIVQQQRRDEGNSVVIKSERNYRDGSNDDADRDIVRGR
ncbi:hypothetical protein RD792_006641 [Penstemon davidsonii]|uniref:LOB domain-containing protein n=1 Tax=Penstemon davidsonii TaxID=160366 RepID=A0ABR0DBY1_9LAMI|nr:hypothetical protein RD792_006641 [Penstemon davidsonii]